MPLLKYAKINVEELEGVGKATAAKLRKLGIYYVEDILFANPRELADELGEEKAKQLLESAVKLLEKQGAYKHFVTAYEWYELSRGERKKLTTGCRKLNELLDGGLETRSIYEFIGEFGAGKTQICHQLAVTVQLPEDKGGLRGKAIYIDTEGTFRPERIVQIAKRFGLDPKEALRNILYSRVYTTDHLFLVLDEVMSRIENEKVNVKLIIVDSIIAHFRAEYPGRECLAERQQRLNQALHKILLMTEKYDAVAVITNQVLSNPGGYFTDALKPAGGHVLAHASTHRIMLRRKRENIRIAEIYDSPSLPQREVEFKITDNGIEDA